MMETMPDPANARLSGDRAGSASGPTFSAADVDTRLIDIGLLLGVLQQVDGTPASGTIGVNFDWFSSAPSELVQFPERAEPLLDLINRLLNELGGPEPIDPVGTPYFGQRNWYPIPY